ncbi:lasso peptide biosynthesis B2 protein [Streptomyces sp. UNOC14_S4]|uniref:lasso peptide biosynthesis B2 protein n=1 Tax=Streptomyces sp. UNOC14_S4 TaxID=2872340 RepID=UPI001E454665|nr:lasso peptide biosynthesis B2 protein [Streptomyces sp. UNOC14_S4]MCC3768559.1 lasso peptide biosynthesis B2 protein [Streptomyces sp. UNOC14_S4]
MTAPATTGDAFRLPLRRRPPAMLAVGAGHLIGRLPPARIRRILTFCARGARPASYTEASRARRTVTAVSVRCAGQGCLPRSIATALLCRTHGSWPVWCAGVRSVPFQAHAWVEAEGRPVDEPLSTTQMRPIVVVPPGRGPSLPDKALPDKALSDKAESP